MTGEHSAITRLVDETTLAEAFEAARPKLLGMVRRRLGPGLAARVDPEGVVQNAYLRARRRWADAAERPADLYAWVYGIVRDRAIDEARAALGPTRDASRDQPWPDESVAQLALRLVPSQTGPSTAAARNEQVALVREATARLRPDDQELLSMHYFDGLTFKQIGAVLGVAENTANARCVRALLKLRKLLPPSRPTDGGGR